MVGRNEARKLVSAKITYRGETCCLLSILYWERLETSGYDASLHLNGTVVSQSSDVDLAGGHALALSPALHQLSTKRISQPAVGTARRQDPVAYSIVLVLDDSNLATRNYRMKRVLPAKRETCGCWDLCV